MRFVAIPFILLAYYTESIFCICLCKITFPALHLFQTFSAHLIFWFTAIAVSFFSCFQEEKNIPQFFFWIFFFWSVSWSKSFGLLTTVFCVNYRSLRIPMKSSTRLVTIIMGGLRQSLFVTNLRVSLRRSLLISLVSPKWFFFFFHSSRFLTHQRNGVMLLGSLADFVFRFFQQFLSLPTKWITRFSVNSDFCSS